MARARYHLLDVFTSRPFTGNPLAVFVDPPELSPAQMQAVANELHLSETVFVRAPAVARGSWATRIFTPGAELPFAGHPTIGTAVLLAELGLVGDTVTLAEGVGDVEVRIERHGTSTAATLRSAQPPTYADAPDRDQLARALSLDPSQLHPRLSPGVWSCGVPFCIIPVADLDALAAATVDIGYLEVHLAGEQIGEIYVMTPVDETFDRWRARMFAPGLGIAEDPATGGAAAAAAGFLAGSRQLHRGPMRWMIDQGVEMGRPSELRVALDTDGGEATAALVGGDAVIVGQGELELPEPA